jgi:hypothetical protein
MTISGGATEAGAGGIGSGSGSGGGDIDGGITGSGFCGGMTIGPEVMQPHKPMHSTANTGKPLAFTGLLDMCHHGLINGLARTPPQGIHGAQF